MSSFRIEEHPVLSFNQSKKEVTFNFNGKQLKGYEGEPIIVALRANGVLKLKEGAKNHTPFGPFCMQGRCCSCAMTIDGKPNVFSCVTELHEGTDVRYSGSELDREAFRKLPSKDRTIAIDENNQKTNHESFDLAIIGAGPAGIEAALAAAEAGVKKIALFDDKSYLGGQLKLQTHTFFGTEELGASVRGYEIANLMTKELEKHPITLKLNSTVVGLYPDNILAFRDQEQLNFVNAKKVICATGASEKFLAFEGNCLPGVMGAGGAQTFMNIYGVRPGKKVLIVGGGNIGVILGYQLIQAGVQVAAIIEASNRMGAYEVHVKKVEALGVPILKRHTIKKAHGTDFVTGATLAELDEKWQTIAGSEKFLEVDTICLAVGLSPLNELLWQTGCEFKLSEELGEVPTFNEFRQTSNPDIFVAGDCAVIGEASIARLEGRIAGLKSSLDLGFKHPQYEERLNNAFQLLDSIQSGTFGGKLGKGKSKITNRLPTGKFELKEYHQEITAESFLGKEKKIIITCHQDIPCNPCEASCHFNAIRIGTEINQPPSVDQTICKGCGLCITACPGRAIKVLQYNYDEATSAITLPYEFLPIPKKDQEVEILGSKGEVLTKGKVIRVNPAKEKTGCGTITVTVDKNVAFKAISVNVTKLAEESGFYSKEHDGHLCAQSQDVFKGDPAKTYVCRCEEVTIQDVYDMIDRGLNSVNDIKRVKRIGMGQCRGLSCTNIIENLIKQKTGKNAQEGFLTKGRRRSIYRPPFKKVTLAEAARLNFTEEESQRLHALEVNRTRPMHLVNQYREENHQIAEKSKSKIVIIGGGISGVFTAWWLAKLGESDVTVVEKDFLTAGKTGACLGGIRTGFNTSNKVMRATKGLEVYRDAKNLIGEDVGWHEGGYVYLAFDQATDQMFKSSAATWEDAKVAHKFVYDRNQFAQYVPGLDAEKVISLVHFPECGGANPFRATYMFAEDAKKMGVKFLIDHEVVEIKKNGNHVAGVVLHDHRANTFKEISAETVVNATGTAAVRVSKMAGIDLSEQIWIERHGAFVTEKMPLWLDPLVVSYHPSLSGYWQQKRMEANINEGELVACFSPSPVIKGFNKFEYLSFLSRMAKSILHCQPSMADVGIVRSFSEHYVGRESGIPFICETPLKGFWLNIAKKGHGFMCAPGDGYALAKSIIDGKTHEWISECTINVAGSFKETMK